MHLDPVARLSIVLAALAVLAEPGGAQRCPEGTGYTYTEDRGKEKIVHCRKQKGVAPAVGALQDSELGGRVLAFLTENKVSIRIDSKRSWAANSGAAFDPVSRAVLLPPTAAERSAVSLAVSIAHEGYHAIQHLDRGMIPCIEVEQDAAFAQNVAYVEMVRKGARRLGAGDPLLRDFGIFRDALSEGDMKTFDLAVELTYGRRRREILHWGDFLPLAGRVLSRILLAFWDLSLDITEDFETLHQRTRHPAYLWDKTPVKRTAKAHEKENEWRTQWAEEHRLELSRDF